MAAVAGQAAGLAVGAAVGSVVPGIGTAVGATTGAAIGAAAGGFFGESEANKIQSQLDNAALEVNREQARLQAAEKSAVHATNFRRALASQVSLASMRGGAGSLVNQFGQEAFSTFLQDQKAIEAGLSISELQSDIQGANNSAKSFTRDVIAATRFASGALEGINLNLLNPKKG